MTKTSPATYVTTLDRAKAEILREQLLSKGFSFTQPPHTVFAAKSSGVSCVLYESGKLVVQGKQKAEFIEFFLEPQILGTFQHGYEEVPSSAAEPAHIGIDESGKGDVFGPLCVAGVYGDARTIGELSKIGVRDSKTVTDAGIAVLARKIRNTCPHHIIRLNPLKYNELYQSFANLNRLLAWGHATAIEQLVRETHCHDVTIDQFAAEAVVETALKRKGIEVHLTQRHRAESDLVVAAASILARHAFLEGLGRLSEEFGITIPKGASHGVIAIGKRLVAKHGPSILQRVAKMHFKTIQQILN